jgi:esterase/lipase superfamily enzyme
MYKPKLENFKVATAKKPTQASQIRAYAANRPDATIADIAHSMGIRYQAVYAVLRAKAPKKPKQKWKNVMLAASKKALVEHLGVTMAKDDVTKLTEEQTARLMFNATQGRTRMQEAVVMIEPKADNVNHPAHYKVGGIETIDFIEAKGLSYHLGNVVKYIARADNKGNRKEDLLKAQWYLNREIAKL